MILVSVDLQDCARPVMDRLLAEGEVPAEARHGLLLAIRAHLEVLAAAVTIAAPTVFGAHLRWHREANGVPVDWLRRLLRAIEAVISERTDLPQGLVRATLGAARDALAAPPDRRASLFDDVQVAGYVAPAVLGHRAEALEVVHRWRTTDGVPAALARLTRAQQDVGEAWLRGELSVAAEHRITAITEQAITLISVSGPPVRPAGSRGRAVVAAAPGDWHVTGPRLAAAFLEHEGWDATLLGGDTPAAALAETAVECRADLVGIGAGTLAALDGVVAAARAVRAARPEARIVAGGWATRVAGAAHLGVDRVLPADFDGKL